MSDPRYTDPRLSDPPHERFSDPVLRRSDSSGDRVWGWIAGVAVIILIGFIVVAGWNNHSNTASTAPSATTGSGASAPMSPPHPAPGPAPSGAPR